MYKSAQSSRSYCIIDYGDIEGYTGFWVEDDETHEEGFLQDTEDVFWLYDDHADAWKVRRVPGRRLRRGPRKGKGKGKKGKGTKGRRKFVPYGKTKGKGKSPFDADGWEDQQYLEEEAGTADPAKGKRKGKRQKGQPKGKGKKGKGQWRLEEW